MGFGEFPPARSISAAAAAASKASASGPRRAVIGVRRGRRASRGSSRAGRAGEGGRCTRRGAPPASRRRQAAGVGLEAAAAGDGFEGLRDDLAVGVVPRPGRGCRRGGEGQRRERFDRHRRRHGRRFVGRGGGLGRCCRGGRCGGLNGGPLGQGGESAVNHGAILAKRDESNINVSKIPYKTAAPTLPSETRLRCPRTRRILQVLTMVQDMTARTGSRHPRDSSSTRSQ